MKKLVTAKKENKELIEDSFNTLNPYKEKQLKKALNRIPGKSVLYDSIEYPDKKMDYFIPGEDK